MSGGYCKYLSNISPGIASNSDVESLICASPASLKIADWFKSIPNAKFVNCKPFMPLSLRSEPDLKQSLDMFSPDVIFIPTERSFQSNNIPVVNMIQNMEPFVDNVNDNPFNEKVRQLVRRTISKMAVKKSDRVIAISEFIRDFMVQSWGVPFERIGVVHHGVNFPVNKGIRPNFDSRERDGLFLLTAGSIRPARGLEDLLHAIKYLSENSCNIPKLVIAGEASHNMINYKRRLEDWIYKHNLTDMVYWAGYLNENEMTWCYQNCRAFIMTSRVEAFAMIAGEALAHGCICIAADNPCLPEIFSETAIYYPPHNIKVLAERIQTVLAFNDSQRNEASKLARKRGAGFTWDICVEKTVAELSRAANNCK